MPFSRVSAVVIVAIGMLLVGCVPLQPRRQAHPVDSIVLFSVTLDGAARLDREPAGLIVDVEAQQGTMIKQFAFTPNSRIPGHHTTFLVRLDLPAGSYSLTRFSGIAADGTPIPQFDVAPQMSFKMRPKGADYVGHLELSRPELSHAELSHAEAGATRDAARLVIADAYEDELPSFVHAWPALRGRAIGRRAGAGVKQIAVQALETPGQSGTAETASQANTSSGVIAPEKLDPTAAAGLPPKARVAFRSFLRGSYPRAFAMTASGYYTGTAIGGVNVIGRALRDCRRAQPAKHRRRCRLFALDDTLLR